MTSPPTWPSSRAYPAPLRRTCRGGPGAQVFANQGCNGCHTLAAADAGGTVGPNLDEVLPGQTAAQISDSIIDPNKVQTSGFPLNVMPQNYEELIPANELKQLVDYLISSTARSRGRQRWWR